MSNITNIETHKNKVEIKSRIQRLSMIKKDLIRNRNINKIPYIQFTIDYLREFLQDDINITEIIHIYGPIRLELRILLIEKWYEDYLTDLSA